MANDDGRAKPRSKKVANGPSGTQTKTVTHYRSLSFLSNTDEPSDRVRCPIHGFIRFSANEREIINSPVFQRLRRIKQLALTDYAYPGATHTRFGHSLGVMEVATQAFDSLLRQKGDLMESTFRSVLGFEKNALAKARQVLRLAALLHDVGHIAFSHAAETVVLNGKSHEDFGIEIIESEDYLGGLLSKRFGEEFPSLVSSLVKKLGPAPQLKVLQDIVSGQMDADRTDYLIRDSHYCGVDYGIFDYRRMVDSLDLYEEEGVLEIALKREGIHTFEALIFARYQMNVQVYFHRIRRLYDQYLKWYFEKAFAGQTISTKELLDLDDYRMMSRIETEAKDSNLPQFEWARRISSRRHHREVFATGVDAKAEALKRSQKLFAKLKDEYTDVHMFCDVAKDKIHKLLLPNDASDEGKVTLRLIRPYGQPISIANESQLLNDLTTEFQCARIFADVADSPSLRSQIRLRAEILWKDMGGR